MVFGFKGKKDIKSEVDVGIPLSKLKPVEGLRHMDWGAPAPLILASEHKLSIAYYLESEGDWDGEITRLRNPKADIDEMAVFYVTGLSSFSQRVTSQPDHLCPFFNYSLNEYPPNEYPSHGVWKVEGPLKQSTLENQFAFPKDIRLIFSFHDTAIDCFCSKFEYEVIVSSGANVLEKMGSFIFPE
ncbi:hypothetical protein [Hellea balneolensis]|uniref:hypothetical protein n=1 Tax=Hellea balneolensis TaxID=287478 RepID=UPI00040A906D|nr:hypothetical protein [Hellea balneolensis]